MRRAGLCLAFRGECCGLTRPWCHCRRLCNRCEPGRGEEGDVGACSPDHTRVCLVFVNISFLILLSESVVDLVCCVDLKKHAISLYSLVCCPYIYYKSF